MYVRLGMQINLTQKYWNVLLGFSCFTLFEGMLNQRLLPLCISYLFLPY